MRYWVHIDNQVQGPFDKEKLASTPGFTVASMAYPEAPAGSEPAAWKAASAYPELLSALTPSPSPAPAPAPAPAPSRPAPAESPLALTMRGSLVGDPAFDAPLPKAPEAVKPFPVSTGTLAPAETAAPVPAPAPAQPDQRLAQLRLKLGQLGTELAAVAETQTQLAGKLAGAVKELKELAGE
ncbi:MAG: hypothetical protein A2X32_08665 [Elusimicrobia bacterium GWC2_64_44]|nr:MAG: hypothetical protein A2X32_08665 [Elusimicrobia bacterium GWC2_64_44]